LYIRARIIKLKTTMGKFIIEEFTFYKVFLYGRKAMGEQTDYRIQINIPSGKVFLNFCKNFMKDNHFEEKNGKYTFEIYLRSDKYPAHIDILRNEKPLFFFYDLDEHLSYLTTTDEPVGEAELSDE